MHRAKFIPPPTNKTYEIESGEDVGELNTVLLLEDDQPFAQHLKEYLESFDYSVTVVPDGVQGLKKVMEKDFRVIICDLLMPNLPGDMFYMAVVRVKPHMSKRFVFITGHQNEPQAADFFRQVRALTLFKPFEMHVLLETISVAIKSSSEGRD